MTINTALLQKIRAAREKPRRLSLSVSSAKYWLVCNARPLWETLYSRPDPKPGTVMGSVCHWWAEKELCSKTEPKEGEERERAWKVLSKRRYPGAEFPTVDELFQLTTPEHRSSTREYVRWVQEKFASATWAAVEKKYPSPSGGPCYVDFAAVLPPRLYVVDLKTSRYAKERPDNGARVQMLTYCKVAWDNLPSSVRETVDEVVAVIWQHGEPHRYVIPRGEMEQNEATMKATARSIRAAHKERDRTVWRRMETPDAEACRWCHHKENCVTRGMK